MKAVRLRVIATSLLVLSGCSGSGGSDDSPGAAGTVATAGMSATAGTDSTAGTLATAGTDSTAGTLATAGTGSTAGTSATDGPIPGEVTTRGTFLLAPWLARVAVCRVAAFQRDLVAWSVYQADAFQALSECVQAAADCDAAKACASTIPTRASLPPTTLPVCKTSMGENVCAGERLVTCADETDAPIELDCTLTGEACMTPTFGDVSCGSPCGQPPACTGSVLTTCGEGVGLDGILLEIDCADAFGTCNPGAVEGAARCE